MNTKAAEHSMNPCLIIVANVTRLQLLATGLCVLVIHSQCIVRAQLFPSINIIITIPIPFPSPFSMSFFQSPEISKMFVHPPFPPHSDRRQVCSRSHQVCSHSRQFCSHSQNVKFAATSDLMQECHQ